MKDTEKNKMTRSGFTLVELVVVIVILGVLAGVAYPAYTGYIKKANDAKVEAELNEVLLAVEASCAELGIDINKDLDGEVHDGPNSFYIQFGSMGANTELAYVKMRCFADKFSENATVNEDGTRTLMINGSPVSNRDVEHCMYVYGDGLFKEDGIDKATGHKDRIIAQLNPDQFPTLCSGLQNTSYGGKDEKQNLCWYFAWNHLTGWYTNLDRPNPLPEGYKYLDAYDNAFWINFTS